LRGKQSPADAEDVMVDAVLDRLAGVNFLTWQSPAGDGRPTPIDASRLKYHGDAAAALSQASPSDTPATVVTFSAEARDQLSSLTLPELPERPALALSDPAPSSRLPPFDFERHRKLAELEMKLGLLDRLEDMRAGRAESLKNLEASYIKMRDTPPKAAVKLDAKGVEKALKMLKDAGVALRIPGKDGNFGYGQDGVIYMFKGDGTVTAEENGVATSLENQQRALSQMDDMRVRLHDWLRDTSAERAALVAQRDALTGSAS
jgi:hypothetical protein